MLQGGPVVPVVACSRTMSYASPLGCPMAAGPQLRLVEERQVPEVVRGADRGRVDASLGQRLR